MNRGFLPVKLPPDGKIEILSSEGEAICRMKDGVEYVLRFGQIVAADNGDEAKKDADKTDDKPEKGKPDEKDAGASRLNRYMFVMARFNQDLIPKPKLDETPADQPAGSPDASGDKKAGQADAAPKASAPNTKTPPQPPATAPKTDKKPGDKAPPTDKTPPAGKPAPAAKPPASKPATGTAPPSPLPTNRLATSLRADAGKNEVRRGR